MAIVLGAGLAVLPGVASSETTPTINATEEPGYTETSFHWTPSQVDVASGGTVRFVNGSMTVPHGIVWSGGPVTPTCEASVPVGATSSGTNWNGACTFAQAGTYTFYCSVHGPNMSGSVVVTSTGATTTTTGTTTTPPMTTSTGATTPPPSSKQSPLAGPLSQVLKLAKSQRGGSVHGSIAISNAGAGGRLEVDLFAQSAALAKAKRRAPVRVGHLVRSALSAGKLPFSVRLNARARRAIRRRRRLALTVKVIVTPAHGEPVTATRAVVERG